MNVKINQQRYKLCFAVGDYIHYNLRKRGFIIGIMPTPPDSDEFKTKKRLTQVSFVVLNIDADEFRQELKDSDESW